MMLNIENISKSYYLPENNFPVLSSISLSVEKGRIVSVYGPNGSGKSTLLKIIAGVLKPDEGKINYDCDFNQLKIGYVWQDYSESLFPWYSVKQNIELPLKLSGQKIDNVAADLIEELGFDINLDTFPYQLSGGQQQMIAIARALSNNPSILILDEPFSALDMKKRELALIGLRRYCEQKKPIVFFVSHSLDESIRFCDSLVLFSDNPSKIIGSIDIEFEHNRDATILTTPRFIDYRSTALEMLNKEIDL